MTTLFVVLAAVGVGGLLLGFVFDDVLDGLFDAFDLDGGGVLSMPVIGAFLGAFGIGGLIVANATDDQVVVSFVGATAGGIAIGYLALKLSTALIDMPTDPTLTSGDYMGQIGRVVTDIAGGRGEIMLRVAGAPRKLTALADETIGRGDDVVVIEVVSSSSVRVIPFNQILEDSSP